MTPSLPSPYHQQQQPPDTANRHDVVHPHFFLSHPFLPLSQSCPLLSGWRMSKTPCFPERTSFASDSLRQSEVTRVDNANVSRLCCCVCVCVFVYLMQPKNQLASLQNGPLGRKLDVVGKGTAQGLASVKRWHCLGSPTDDGVAWPHTLFRAATNMHTCAHMYQRARACPYVPAGRAILEHTIAYSITLLRAMVHMTHTTACTDALSRGRAHLCCLTRG